MATPGLIQQGKLRSIDFDPMLRVEDAQGKVLGQNDDIVAGQLTNRRLGFVAPRAGTYRLVVTSFDPGRMGEYVLEAAGLEPAGEAPVVKGELAEKSPAAQGRRYQLQQVATEPGRWYLIDLRSDAFAPSLVLRNGKGQALAADDHGGEGLDALLVWPPGQGGPWQVVVLAAQPGAGGNYLLRMTPYRGEWKARPSEREKRIYKAWGLGSRVVALYRADRFGDAIEPQREALATFRELYPKDRYPQGHPELAQSLDSLGRCCRPRASTPSRAAISTRRWRCGASCTPRSATRRDTLTSRKA